MTHRVAEVSFSKHVCSCTCGHVIRVHVTALDTRESVNNRLADAFRRHRDGLA